MKSQFKNLALVSLILGSVSAFAAEPSRAAGPARDGQPAINVEDRYDRTPKKAFIFDGVGFVDVGNVFQRTKDFSFTDLRKTAGAGVRLRTKWVLVRGDYGWVLDRREGERRGRFYFSIGQAF